MKKKNMTLGSAILMLALAGCEQAPAPTGADTITEADLHEKISVLAADEFQGRAPSSPGEELTINYLRDELASYGVAPGNDGSWFQEVPLVDLTASADQTLVITGGAGEDISLTYADDYVAVTRRVVENIDIADSELVFVGYGIVAPEYGWNDYAGVDMTGKTAVILVNDPGYATRDENLFNGFAMTYYGRWTYKYEEAMRQGADAAIVIHENGAAGYPWAVVRAGWTGRGFYLESADGNMSRVKAEGWITQDSAQAIFAKAGLDFAGLSAAAMQQGFTPVPMGLTASVSFTNEINHSVSKNVVGVVPGSENPNEAFIYMAHWDHLGIGEEIDGDGIYNGGFDNASGTAALLELAEAFASLEVKPRRSIVFVAVTAEEQGLLGSQHYAENPLFDLNKTIGGLNIDGLNVIGPTNDIIVTGFGLSELDAFLERAAAGQGRVLAPDPDVEKGYYYRSDHFNLAKVGVPMIYPGNGIDHVEFGPEYGQAKADEYTAQHYHKPSDEYDPDWDLSGGVLDTKLFFAVGLDVADGDVWPNWVIGSEFRAIRDESLQEASAGELIRVTSAITLDATADEVWEQIGKYSAVADWHPAVKEVEVEGDGVGAIRKLYLEDGGVIVEKLDSVDPKARSYSYSIVESPLPVEDYKATFAVKEKGAQCVLEWQSTFKAKGVPAKQAQEMIEAIYSEGFTEIRNLVGF